MSPTVHVPVLLEPVLELLGPAVGHDGAVAIDATLGLGGHTEALLERFGGLTVVGIDRDPAALALAGGRLARFGDRFRPAHAVYDRIPEVLEDLGIRVVDGVLFDLGVSSMQLDRNERGFSYARDTALDMRMDPHDPATAADVIATYPESELTRIFRTYGEERLAARYARAIVAARATAPLTRSGELVAVLDAATPAALKSAGHPAKRVFQALRIEVNRELEVLQAAVPAALDALAIHGRIVALSYHSLEDRIVKRAITARTVSTAPRGLPVEPEEAAATFRMLTRGAPGADAAEVEKNPRAASVRLRSAERVRGNA